MILLGVVLRSYPPIPELYRAILYLGIANSLFLASPRYYRSLSRTIFLNQLGIENQIDR